MDKEVYLELLRESLHELSDPNIQIWPQTMPPFPWHWSVPI